MEDQGYVEVNDTHPGPYPSQDTTSEYILDSPAQVLEGDFIVFEQLDSNSTRFLPLLISNTGYDLYFVFLTLNERIFGT